VIAAKDHVNVIMIVVVDLIVDVAQNFKLTVSVSAIKDVNVGIIVNASKNALPVQNIKSKLSNIVEKGKLKNTYLN